MINQYFSLFVGLLVGFFRFGEGSGMIASGGVPSDSGEWDFL
jgi:hypothetical protein